MSHLAHGRRPSKLLVVIVVMGHGGIPGVEMQHSERCG